VPIRARKQVEKYGMSNFLISVRPRYAEKILSGEKTVELRRRFPTLSNGGTALIYSSSPVCAIVGYTQIKDVKNVTISQIWRRYRDHACISKSEFYDYFAGLKLGFALILTGTKTFGRQLDSSLLRDRYGIVPPQSYRYLNGEFPKLLIDGRLQISHRHKRRNRA